MAGLFKKLLGREDSPGAAAVPQAVAYDAAPAEAAYERLVAAALLLRNLDAELATAAAGIAEREERLRASSEEYERIAQAAIAGGRTIQAESAIASAETAQAALDALAPRAEEIAALRAEAETAAGRAESEAVALRQRIDARTPLTDVGVAASRAEDDAIRLASLARTFAS